MLEMSDKLTVEKADATAVPANADVVEATEADGNEGDEAKTGKGSGDKTQIYSDTFHTNIQIPPKLVLPKVKENPENYVPMPYIFRLPTMSTPSNVIHQAARTPPFYVQLDHTIAVIWDLFNSSEFQKSLGINQLQWALAFLKTIKNQKGRSPRDVAFCIDVISNELLDQYADLVDDVPTKLPRSSQPLAAATAEEVPNTEEERKSSGSKKEDSKASETFKEQGEIVLVQQNVPFSINYADMINRSPPRLVDTDNAKPVCPEDIMSKNMGGFLDQWRKEQMKKILLELDRLHSIETYMRSGGGAFQPYMDDKDTEMSAMLAEKMKEAQIQK